jgi:hypothetical protein
MTCAVLGQLWPDFVKKCRSAFDVLRTNGKAVEFAMNLIPFVVSLSNHERLFRPSIDPEGLGFEAAVSP